MKERDGGSRCGGAKRGQKNNFGPPWNTLRKLKGRRGVVRRWTCSRTVTKRERNYGWVIGML